MYYFTFHVTDVNITCIPLGVKIKIKLLLLLISLSRVFFSSIGFNQVALVKYACLIVKGGKIHLRGRSVVFYTVSP